MKRGTYQTIERKVASIASQFNGWSYIYEGYNSANEEIARKSLPCIINVLPESGNFVLTKNQQVEEANCVIAFCDWMQFDFNGKENDEQVVEKLKRCAQAFIFALNESGLFYPIGDEIPYDVMFDKLDDNVAIVAISLTLREREGIAICSNTTVGNILQYG